VVIVEPAKNTVKEWLSEMPEPYRTQALENLQNNNGYAGSNNICKSTHSAITYGFLWQTTPQGVDYWRAVWRSFCEGTPLPAPWVKPQPDPFQATEHIFPAKVAEAVTEKESLLTIKTQLADLTDLLLEVGVKLQKQEREITELNHLVSGLRIKIQSMADVVKQQAELTITLSNQIQQSISNDGKLIVQLAKNNQALRAKDIDNSLHTMD
jgi:hypothetical protein